MAEPREGLARRQSFRKTLSEAALSPEFLDALEQKRKHLDESIHKYIAAKEREYKQFEKDIRQQFRGSQDRAALQATTEHQASSGSAQRLENAPPTSEPAVAAHATTANHRRHSLPISSDSPVLSEVREDQPAGCGGSTAAPLDRRASVERDKEFVGLFTPSYLPALGEPRQSGEHRPSPNPLSPLNTGVDTHGEGAKATLDNASDSNSLQVGKPLSQHHSNSSSGSSADGKLTSAMKSPITTNRPARKRVSLALGDTIVAPSDSVPEGLSHFSTSSHSRTRPPSVELNASQLSDIIRNSTSDAFTLDAQDVSQAGTKTSDPASSKNDAEVESEVRATAPSSPRSPRRSPKPAIAIDPDGDLFDLEEAEDANHAGTFDSGSPFESEDEISGRLATSGPHHLSPTSSSKADTENAVVDVSEEDDDNHALHIESVPVSSVASQQPTKPGFRRPSATMDPIYAGTNYHRAELNAVENDVYGSSYGRPPSKGSFTSGSLGESYMAKNAEKLMRERTPAKG